MVQVTIEQIEDKPKAEADSTPRKRRWPRVLLGMFFVLLLVVAGIAVMLPQILSMTAMKQQIADGLMRDFDGTLEIDNANLAWWKPAQVSGLTVRDKQGGALAKIASAEVSTPLWKLLWSGPESLELKIKGPELYYEVSAYGETNWEKVFGAAGSNSWKWPELKHGSNPINLKIVDGKVTVLDRVTNRKIEVDDIQIQLQKSTKLLSGLLTSQTVLTTENQSPQPAGKVSANFQLAMVDNQVTAGDVQGQIEKTPLELIQPWLKQFVPHLHLAASNTDGKFTTKWTGSFKEGFKLAFDGTLTAQDFKMESSEWIPGNQLSSSNFTASIKVDNTLPTAPGKFNLRCDMANCVVTSKVPEQNSTLEGTPNDPVQAAMPPLDLGQFILQSDGTIGVAANSINLDSLTLKTKPGQISMAGTILDRNTRPLLDLTGNGEGDVMPLLQLAAPNLQNVIDVEKLSLSEFAVKGHLPQSETKDVPTVSNKSPAQQPELKTTEENLIEEQTLSAVALWKWDNLECYGIESERGELWTKYSDDILKIVPVTVRIGAEGKFAGVSRIEFGKGDQPNRFVMEPGMVLENVEFTEPMCRSWLKYVSPVFANATELSGKFSLGMKTLVVDMQTGTPDKLEGSLLVHSCRLGPGPMVVSATAPISGMMRLAGGDADTGFLKEGAKWLELPEQSIGFVRRGERIYHDSLTFQAGKISVVSSGSVGLDQTLDISLTIPLDLLPEKTGAVAQFLRSQPVEIKVQGTFDKPQVVSAPLKKLGAGAVEGLLKGLLNRRRNNP